jgi:hypothetical protein
MIYTSEKGKLALNPGRVCQYLVRHSVGKLMDELARSCAQLVLRAARLNGTAVRKLTVGRRSGKEGIEGKIGVQRSWEDFKVRLG